MKLKDIKHIKISEDYGVEIIVLLWAILFFIAMVCLTLAERFDRVEKIVYENSIREEQPEYSKW